MCEYLGRVSFSHDTYMYKQALLEFLVQVGFCFVAEGSLILSTPVYWNMYIIV